MEVEVVETPHVALLLTLLGDDELEHIVRAVCPDDLLAASLSCQQMNHARRAAGLRLCTSIVSTTRSTAVQEWAAALGCPSPFPCWAYTHSLHKAPEHNNKVVRVQSTANDNGRHVVCINARLFLQRMIRDPTQPSYSGREDAIKQCTKAMLLRPDNLRLLQAHEVARLVVFVIDAMVPTQRCTLPLHTVSHLQAMAADLSAQAGLGHAPLRFGFVGKRMHGSGPLLVGVSVDEITRGHEDEEGSEESQGSSATRTFVARRPFEVLEVWLPVGFRTPTREEVAFDSESLSVLFAGRCSCFVATVRWLPQLTSHMALPPINPVREPHPDPILAAIRDKIDRWIQLVRSTGRERSPGQLDGILRDIGGLPQGGPSQSGPSRSGLPPQGEPPQCSAPSDPLALVIFVAALINPLPALGVAPEIRGWVLEDLNTPDVPMAIRRVHWGLTASIENMQGMPITLRPEELRWS